MGAPDSACQALTPGHTNTSPQNGESPSELRLSQQNVVPGQIIQLELSTNDNSTFKGFIIQARDSKLKDQQVGSFILSGDVASYITCGRGIHNSITHRTSSSKSSIQAQWLAPTDFDGEVIFRYSFLKEFKTYWVGLETDRIRVTREVVKDDVEDKSTTEINAADKTTDEIIPSAKSEDDLIKVVEKEESTVEKDKSIDKQLNEIKNSLSEDIPQPAQNALIPKDALETSEKIQEEEFNTPIYRSSTTTLPTTSTSSEAPESQEQASDGTQTDPSDPIFEGCENTKACYGYPDGCISQGKCEVVLSYEPQQLNYLFKMKGRTSGYIAMGLSKDAKMGDDLTTNCYRSANGRIDISTGINVKYGNKLIPRGKNREFKDGIISRGDGFYEDGWITCSWVRNSTTIIDDNVWDIQRDRYHIMLARGPVSADGDIQFHKEKIVSGALRGLGEVEAIQSKSNLFIFLHGAFMLGAWICSASLGIIMARYFKQTWTSRRCFNLDQWFIWHRNFMMLTWVLTMAGFTLIILELKDISTTINTNPHAIIGFVTVGLCFLQPFLALVRCSPSHQYRPLFNWVHWLIGNVAQILAIVCIFYAVDLSKAQLPRPETDWLLVAFVAFHFLTHLILSCINCNADNNKIGYSGSYPPTMRHLGRGSMFPDYEELKRDAPGSTVRLFVLVVYCLVNVIVTTALILLVVLAPTGCQLEKMGILTSKCI